MELCPILPPAYQEEVKDSAVRRLDPDGTKTIWYPDGEVSMYLPDGMVKTWFPKPTMHDAVECSSYPSPARTSFQFHKGGAVTAWIYDGSYYWSPPLDVKPVEGPFDIGYPVRNGWSFDDREARDDAEDSYYYRYGRS